MSILAKSSLFLHMTSRKAYCKQLNPHSFIKKFKQTNERTKPRNQKKKKKEKKKGMVSDAVLAEGDLVTPHFDSWDK